MIREEWIHDFKLWERVCETKITESLKTKIFLEVIQAVDIEEVFTMKEMYELFPGIFRVIKMGYIDDNGVKRHYDDEFGVREKKRWEVNFDQNNYSTVNAPERIKQPVK